VVAAIVAIGLLIVGFLTFRRVRRWLKQRKTAVEATVSPTA
jgi:hypothetical protein